MTCPTPDMTRSACGWNLHNEFRSNVDMSFGEYAARYVQHLHARGGLQRAAAPVLTAAAVGRLPISYCVNAYIPGYASRADAQAARPNVDRTWPVGPSWRRLPPRHPGLGTPRLFVAHHICGGLL